MKSFDGKLAVITGGGTGMGRELAVSSPPKAATSRSATSHRSRWPRRRRSARRRRPAGCESARTLPTSPTRRRCSPSATPGRRARRRPRPPPLQQRGHRRRRQLRRRRARGVGQDLRGLLVRRLLLLARVPAVAARGAAAHLVNTSSVNGFWACLGPRTAHTAYSAAKFAVKGFTEALINDFRLNAPHVKVSVVMPGHIGTVDRRSTPARCCAGATRRR